MKHRRTAWIGLGTLLALALACESAREEEPLPPEIASAMAVAADLDATFRLQVASGGAAGLRDALPTALPEAQTLAAGGPPARDAMLAAFEGTPAFEEDLTLTTYAWALERMGNPAVVATLQAFLSDNVTGDLFWTPHFVARAILTLRQDPGATDRAWFDDGQLRAAATGSAGSGLTSAGSAPRAEVARALAASRSCWKRYVVVDGDGVPVTWTDEDGATHPVVIRGQEWEIPDVPAITEENYLESVPRGGGTFVHTEPDFQGRPDRRFNCAGYAFRSFNGGQRWTADPGEVYEPLVASGLLEPVAESDAQPGDTVFYFREDMDEPGHVAEVHAVDDGLFGADITVRNADGQSGLWDADIDAGYFTGVDGATPTYPTRSVFRWRDGQPPNVIPDPSHEGLPDRCGATAPADTSFAATPTIPGFEVSFVTASVAAGVIPDELAVYPAMAGAVSVEALTAAAPGDDVSSFLLVLDANQVRSPGSFAVGPTLDVFVADEPTAAATVSYLPTEVTDSEGLRVSFAGSGGTVTITRWAAASGERLEGTFDVTVTGQRFTGQDADDLAVYEEVSGTVTGRFDVTLR